MLFTRHEDGSFTEEVIFAAGQQEGTFLFLLCDTLRRIRTYLTGTTPPVFRRIGGPSANELDAVVERIAGRIGRALVQPGRAT